MGATAKATFRCSDCGELTENVVFDGDTPICTTCDETPEHEAACSYCDGTGVVVTDPDQGQREDCFVCRPIGRL